jgi:hypothetical protein
VKPARWAAIAVTVLMSLMNLGVLLTASDHDFPVAVVVASSVLAVAGFAAAIGLALRTTWARGSVLAVGALNAVGAVISMIAEREGAFIGLAVSILILALGLLAPGTEARQAATPAPAVR